MTFTRRNTIFTICIALFLFSLILNLYALNSVPGNINPDAADTLQTYLQHTMGRDPDLFGFNWNGAPFINSFLIGSIWRLSGYQVWGYRLLPAVAGALCVMLVCFLLIRLTQSLPVSVVSTTLLATNGWFLNFARSGWENIFTCIPVLMAVAGLYYLFERHEKRVATILLSLASVGGFYAYHPGKLIFPAVTGILIWYVVKNRTKQAILLTGTVLASTLLFIAPHIIWASLSPINLLGRIQTVSVLEKGPGDKQSMVDHIKENLLGFTFFRRENFSDIYTNNRYIHPEDGPISIVVVPAYLIGLFYALHRKPYIATLYILLLLPVELFSKNTPNAARAVHIVPLIFLLFGIGLNQVNTLIQERTQGIRFVPLVTNGILLLTTLVLGLASVKSYYSWIQSEKTLQHRQPAIDVTDLPLWTRTQIDRIRNNKAGLNVQEWRDTYVDTE